MWSQRGFIPAWLALFLSVITPAFGFSTPIEPVFLQCGLGNVIRGQPETQTINKICGNDFNLHVEESLITPDIFPLSLDVSTEDEFGTTTDPITTQINSPDDFTGGDLGSLIQTDASLNIPDGNCDNRDVWVFFNLTWTEDSKQGSFEKRVQRRVWCDFSGVMLKIARDGEDELPTIMINKTMDNLKDAMKEGFGITVTTTNDGSPIPEIVPAPGEPDSIPPGVFAAAFITQYRTDMVLSQEDCRANEDHPMRKPMPGDRIVFMKQFKNDEELKSLDFFGTVKQNTDKLDLCGEHVLVLMLDPMHTMWNEIDRCDNYFALRISSTRNCDEVHPQCEVIRNGWTGGDMRVVRRGTDPHTAEPTVSVFENDGSAWKEIHNKTQDTAGNLGFGRLSLLQNFIDLHIAANPSVCEKNFTEMVQAMEGSAETEADSKDTLESLPDNFIIAQQQMEKLQNGGNKENVKAVLQGVLSSLNTESSGFLSRLKEKIVKQAVKRGISEADGSLNGTGRDICNRLPEELDRLRWIHDKPTDATNETVISVAGELAEAVISNPEFPCLEKMLKRFIRYAKDAETNGYPDTTFLFSEDDVNEEDDLYHCARPNKCIQKIRRVCETKHTADWEDITVSREEICKLHVMKATARSQHKSLGMEDLHEKLKEDEAKEGRHCTRDPLKPRRDPTLFWKTMTDAESGNTFVLKGVLNSDATKMAWMKVAVCSCCGGDDSTESMTEQTKDFTKKRRRK